jgi:hypothetical protein
MHHTQKVLSPQSEEVVQRYEAPVRLRNRIEVVVQTFFIKRGSVTSAAMLAGSVLSYALPLLGAPAQPDKMVKVKPQAHVNAGTLAAQEAKINKLPCAVSGTVREASGAAVPNATVQVIETATGATHSVTADGSGNYCATSLPVGKYSVIFTKAGLRSTRVDALNVALDRTAQANAVLPVVAQAPKHDEAGKIAAPSIPSPAPSPVKEGDPVPPPPVPVPIAPQPTAPQPTQPQPSGSHSASSDPAAALGEAEAQWFSQLHSGSILYDVPLQMTIGKPTTVSVTINGYQAPPAPTNSDGTAPAQLKVSEWMRVEATQPDNPDEFTISGDPNQNPQFVPIDSGATWSWTVTPNHLGANQKLQFQAFVLYKDDTSKVQRALPSAEKIVTVQAEGVNGIVHQIDDNFWTNPLNWFKYMLPGGAGFATLVAILAWWRKRRKPQDEDAPKPPPK